MITDYLNTTNLSKELINTIKESWNLKINNFGKNIMFSKPQKTIPLSLTAQNCSLNCSHCGGHYLKHMSTLDNINKILIEKKYKSCLVSGGCNTSGAIEFTPFIDDLKKLKSAGIQLNVHTGLIDDSEIALIAPLSNSISFDLVTDNETIKNVYNLDKTGDDYIRIYKKLCAQNNNVIPHICIGLNGGKVKGEFDAINKLKESSASKLVFIILNPTPNTKFENCAPPSLEDIAKVLCHARTVFEKTPIYLGCMKPGGKYREEIDQIALFCGVNKLVNPTPKVLRIAEELGLEISFDEECCIL